VWINALARSIWSLICSITPDLPAPIMSNPNHGLAGARTRQQEHCRERPCQKFHASCPSQM
jgi:hypothetical protein